MSVRYLSALLAALALALAGPGRAAPPPGATARCADGSYSFSSHRSGTCSHHGGVAQWLTGSSTLAVSAAHARAAASVRLARRTRISGCVDGVLPDRRCSPGAYDPRVTQANVVSTICVRGYAGSVRDVPQSEKDAVYREYGIARHAPYSYEVDHIVSLELGGSNDIANLYPESYLIADGAHVKDRLENRLHALVCEGRLSLRAAQHRIALNWLAALHAFGA